jgi:hypothetical protein
MFLAGTKLLVLNYLLLMNIVDVHMEVGNTDGLLID